MNFKEDDAVLCTVKRIEGTTVFLDIEGGGEGSMVFSEVSPGRIRNIREFVVPNKKIVCKVLKINGGHVQLSLRRVTGKEREETLERYTKEKTLTTIINQALGKESSSVIAKISEEYDLAQFLDEARINPSLIEKFVSKEEAEQLKKIFAEKREKEKEIKKTVVVKTMNESGVEDVKEVLETKEAEVNYLGSSRFMIAVKESDFKKANLKMDSILKAMADRAKKLKVQFEIK